MDDWYDAENFTPHLVYEVELPGGEIINARFAMGDWETMGGQIVYPVRFRKPGVIVTRASYSYTDGEDTPDFGNGEWLDDE